MSRVLNLLLAHQDPPFLQRLVNHWQPVAGAENLLLAYGGHREAFAEIAFAPKVFIDDPRLRTVDHQREMQSYSGVFRAASEWLAGRDYTHIYFAESDHLPLVPDLTYRLLQRLQQEHADVLGHHVRRVDGSSQAHYLYHLRSRAFAAYWKAITCRSDGSTVLSMFGTGSFWTRDAFEAVATHEEPFPMYLEIYLPTLAHHLGFRIRDLAEQNRFVQSLGELSGETRQARAAGAWTLHPVKRLLLSTS